MPMRCVGGDCVDERGRNGQCRFRLVLQEFDSEGDAKAVAADEAQPSAQVRYKQLQQKYKKLADKHARLKAQLDGQVSGRMRATACCGVRRRFGVGSGLVRPLPAGAWRRRGGYISDA
jgi:hypothetical protein